MAFFVRVSRTLRRFQWSQQVKQSMHAMLHLTMEEWLPGLSLEGFLWDDAQEEREAAKLADDFLNFRSS